MSKSAAWHTINAEFGIYKYGEDEPKNDPDYDPVRSVFDWERWKPVYGMMYHRIESASHEQIKKVLVKYRQTKIIDWWSAMGFDESEDIAEAVKVANGKSFEEYRKQWNESKAAGEVESSSETLQSG